MVGVAWLVLHGWCTVCAKERSTYQTPLYQTPTCPHSWLVDTSFERTLTHTTHTNLPAQLVGGDVEGRERVHALQLAQVRRRQRLRRRRALPGWLLLLRLLRAALAARRRCSRPAVRGLLGGPLHGLHGRGAGGALRLRDGRCPFPRCPFPGRGRVWLFREQLRVESLVS